MPIQDYKFWRNKEVSLFNIMNRISDKELIAYSIIGRKEFEEFMGQSGKK